MNGDEIMILGICAGSALACVWGLMKSFFPERRDEADWTQSIR